MSFESNSENTISEAALQQWKADRMGKFTSSAMNKIISKGRSKDKTFSDAGETYIYAKIGETLTGEANEVSGPAIKWGEENEPHADATFQSLSGYAVEAYGKANPVFFPYDKDPEHAGGSPDGMIRGIKVGDLEGDFVVEYKCPYVSGNHAEVLHLIKTGKFDLKSFDADYYAQVQANMYFTKAVGGFFVSYDPRCVEYKYCCVWCFIPRDEEFISNMIERLDMAIDIKEITLTDIGFFNEENIAA